MIVGVLRAEGYNLNVSTLELFVLNHLFWAYVIVFFGMFIEGEVIFLTAAILAWQGYLHWDLLALVTFVGVVLGDIFWYLIGYGLERSTLLNFLFKIRLSHYQQWLEENFLKRYYRMAIYSKFLYYINRLTPIIAGWHKFNFGRFIKIHFLAAVIWVGVNLIFGYSFGYVVGESGLRWLLERFGYLLIGLLIFVAGGEYFLKKLFSQKIKKALEKARTKLTG